MAEIEIQTAQDTRIPQDIQISNEIMRIELGGDRISIRAYCFIQGVDTADVSDQSISAELVDSETGDSADLAVTRHKDTAVNEWFGTVYDNDTGEAVINDYSASVFSMELPLTSHRMPGKYTFRISYKNSRCSGSYTLHTDKANIIEAFSGQSISDAGTSRRIEFDEQGDLVLEIQPAGESADGRNAQHICCITACHAQNGVLTGMINSPSAEAELVYYDESAGRYASLCKVQTAEDFTACCAAAFAVDFNSEKLLGNLYEARHRVQVRMPDNEPQVSSVYMTGPCSVMTEAGDRTLTFFPDETGQLCFRVTRTCAESKNSRKHSKKFLYPEYRKEPIDKKCIMFEAYWGRKYSCNPRGLYEYINDNYPEYKCVWSLNDEKTPVYGNAIRVRRQSPEYYHYLATAKYFVSNVNFEPRKKKKAQVEIHTTHGTPYKKVVMDVYDSDAPRQRQLKAVKNWDYLVVQGRFGEENGPRWYGFENTILKTGYPRTDCLFDITETEKQRLREKFGLPSGKKIILYAPTFREEQIFEMQMDLDAMRSALADDHILMIRLHHFTTDAYKVPADGSFIFDMGSCEDISDLYKISDIMITDYSSVMFDYALTGGRMIFFTYDLEEYTQNIRGCYFDIEKEAPGPIVRTTEELIESILHPDDSYETRLDEFRDKYLTYERPDSSREIFETVLRNEREKEARKKQEKKAAGAGTKKSKKKASLFRRIIRKLRKLI